MMALLEDFSTTLARCPGRNMIPLEVSHRAQTNPGTTRGDSWKSLTDAFAHRFLDWERTGLDRRVDLGGSDGTRTRGLLRDRQVF
jgi:hypothetical protein